MAHDELYEQSLIQRLNEVERTREWLERELREVRNRLQCKRSRQTRRAVRHDKQRLHLATTLADSLP